MKFSPLLRALDRVSAPDTVSAHCDIPCGIYDPHAAQIAALTVLRMDQLIENLEPRQPGHGRDAYATPARYTATKEQHAELCKRELDILWHDYFRPEHLEKYPDLHTMFWMADKLASRNKQNIDAAAAERPAGRARNRIAEIFWDDQERPHPHAAGSNQAVGGELVYTAN